MFKQRTKSAPVELSAFYAAEYPRVVGAMRLYTGNQTLAEDIAQDAFVKLCRDWEKVSKMAAPGAWVHRVAMNSAKSNFRRQKVLKTKAPILRTEAISRSADRSETQGASTTAQAVRDALMELPHDLRAVVVLRYFADFSVAETATALDVPEGTVKTRTRKALAELGDLGLEFELEYVDA